MIWRKGCRANQSGLKMHNGPVPDLTWSFANSFCMSSFGELDMLAVNDIPSLCQNHCRHDYRHSNFT